MILVVDKDPVFSAVLEDRLHVAGHEVGRLPDRRQVVSAATETPADLLIVEVDPPGDEGLDVISTLRQRPETRSLPILVLSASAAPGDRVAALRAGADDYLSKPCDLEELTLRAERLITTRAVEDRVLHGDLADHPLWELMQYVEQRRQSGDLVLAGKSGGGHIRVQEGKIVAAQWEDLPGAEALLALCGLKQGRFRFVSATGEPAAPAGDELPSIHQVLMEAAALEDELGKRREHLPGSGVPLVATGSAPPPLDGGPTAQATVADVLRLVSDKPGLRLYDLINRLPLAPQKVRLAAAWLVEQGALALPGDKRIEGYPTTTEITSSLLLDVAVSEFLEAARQAGLTTSPLPFLILAEPGVWPALLELVGSVPGFRDNDRLGAFHERLGRRHGGSLTFATDHGGLSLHAQMLKGRMQTQIEAVVPACAGVLLWLDDGAEKDLIRRVIERLDRARSAARGMLVATRPESRELVAHLLAEARRWRASPHAPQSLLGVLRLLQPVQGKP